MADNLELNAGSGGAILATDDVTGVHYPINKLAFGALNSATLVTSAAGLPVAAQGAFPITDNDGSLTVDASDLDIRDLTSTDVVTVTGGAGQAADVKVTLDSEAVVLGAGSAAIGKLAANSGVDIGDVDVTSVGGNVTVVQATAGNLNMTEANSAAIKTAVEALDNAISGSEMQVDIVAALPAGTNLIGVAAAGLSTSAIYSGATALTPKWAVINCNTSGNNTIVAAVADKKIRVLQAFVVSAGTVNVRFESGADGTALTGQMPLVVNAGFVLPFSPVGWFETGSNTLLNLELSGAVYVHGNVCYVEV